MKIRRENLPMLVTAFVLVALFGVFSIFFTNFLSVRVVVNLFMNNAHVGVIAVGMTFVILSGGIDLSVGSVLAFTTIFIATLVEKHHFHPILAILTALIFGTLFGAVMGAMIQVYKLPPFLVTLAGMFLARGLAFVVSSNELAIRHPFFESIADIAIPIGKARLGITACIFLVTLVLAAIVAHLTKFGRNVYAIGGNENSAFMMGLPVASTKIAIYAISGFCAALGGVVFTLQTASGNPLNGQGLELDAIAAVVIGGTSLSGGSGSVDGTILGALLMGVINNGLDLLNVSSYYQQIVKGLIIIGAVWLDRSQRT
jgi:simple sugar transport system permease protein